MNATNTKNSAKYIWWSVFFRILGQSAVFRTRDIFKTPSNIYYGEFYSEPQFISYSLMYQLFFRTAGLLLLPYPIGLYQKNDLLLIYSFIQPLLNIWAKELIITHPILDVWQNFGSGLRVKRKEKFFCIFRNVRTLQILLRNEISGNNEVFKVTSYKCLF